MNLNDLYYSLEANKIFTLKEMIEGIPDEEKPVTKEDYRWLFWCFGIELSLL